MSVQAQGVVKQTTGVPGWAWGITSFCGHIRNSLAGKGPLFTIGPAYVQMLHDAIKTKVPFLANVFTFEFLFNTINFLFMAFLIFVTLIAVKTVWSSALTIIMTVVITSLTWIFIFMAGGLGGLLAFMVLQTGSFISSRT